MDMFCVFVKATQKQQCALWQTAMNGNTRNYSAAKTKPFSDRLLTESLQLNELERDSGMRVARHRSLLELRQDDAREPGLPEYCKVYFL